MPYESGVLKPWVGKTWARRGDVGQRSTAPCEAFGSLVPDTLLRPQPYLFEFLAVQNILFKDHSGTWLNVAAEAAKELGIIGERGGTLR
jgi:hypothetical protein